WLFHQPARECGTGMPFLLGAPASLADREPVPGVPWCPGPGRRRWCVPVDCPDAGALLRILWPAAQDRACGIGGGTRGGDAAAVAAGGWLHRVPVAAGNQLLHARGNGDGLVVAGGRSGDGDSAAAVHDRRAAVAAVDGGLPAIHRAIPAVRL